MLPLSQPLCPLGVQPQCCTPRRVDTCAMPWQEACQVNQATDVHLGRASLPLSLSCCPSPPPDPWNLKRPRFCLLSKEEGRSFGFHLQQQLGRPGHVVCRVEPGSSAQRQGLREGDLILAVNNDVVEHEDYVVVRLGWDSQWYGRAFHSILGRKASQPPPAALWQQGHKSPHAPGLRGAQVGRVGWRHLESWFPW